MKALAFLYAAALAASALLLRRFHYPGRAWALHALLLLVPLAAAAGLSVLLRRRPKALALLWAGLSWALAVYYPLCYLANRHWGAHPHASVIWSAFRSPANFWDALGFLGPALLAAAGMAGALAWGWLRRAEGLAGGFGRLPPWSAGLLFALAGGIGWGFQASNHPLSDGDWKGEPLSMLFKIEAFPVTPLRLEAVHADQKARERWKAPPGFRRANVVILLCDGLRPDRMGVYGYGRDTTPFLSGLRAQGKLAMGRRAWAAANNTPSGTLALLASREEPRLGKPLFKINELLRDAGYRSRFFFSGDASWFGMRALFGEGELVDGYDLGGDWQGDDERLLGALGRLGPPSAGGEFIYVHLFSSHQAGLKRKEYQAFLPTPLHMDWRQFFGGKPDPVHASNRYDNGVLQADAYAARIFAALKAQGYLKDAIVLLSSDHGENLGEHGRYGHSLVLDEANLRIPLLIYDSARTWPDIAAATHIDLAPTLLEALGLPRPWTWEGLPLQRPLPRRVTLHAGRSQPPRQVLLEWEPGSGPKQEALER